MFEEILFEQGHSPAHGVGSPVADGRGRFIADNYEWRLTHDCVRVGWQFAVELLDVRRYRGRTNTGNRDTTNAQAEYNSN